MFFFSFLDGGACKKSCSAVYITKIIKEVTFVQGKYNDWLTDDGLKAIVSWAEKGLSVSQIAANMGIARSTLCAWVNAYPDISDAIKKARRKPDEAVENALYRRACGYEAVDEVYAPNERGKLVLTRRTIRHVPSDPASMFFWLKNRMPDKWREKQEVHTEGAITMRFAGMEEAWHG